MKKASVSIASCTWNDNKKNNNNHDESSPFSNRTSRWNDHQTGYIDGVAARSIVANNNSSSSSSNTARFETTQFSATIAKGHHSKNNDNNNNSSNRNKENELQTKKPATARYVAEFHPLSYLFTVVRGNLDDDIDQNGNPRLPTAIPGVLNRRLGRDFNAKTIKLNREIDDIQKRIDGMHEKVNLLNKERCNPENNSNNKGRNFGNEIYLLVRNVGMWMRRMETKAQLIEKIEWSIYILEALQEIDENCNATIFWSYASWRKLQHKIYYKNDNGASSGGGGASSTLTSDWDEDIGDHDLKYDKYKSDTPEIIRLFKDYEAAYKRNIEVSKLIKDNLMRSGSDEKISRFLEDNYTRCKGCRALFCRRYDDLFGTRIQCPSKIKARENLMTKGTTGEEDGSNLIVCFFCTDCFDVFNPSIIKKVKRDKELKIEKDLEVLIREHQLEQEENNSNSNHNSNSNGNGNSSNSNGNGKTNKKRKKKKKKKGKKNNHNAAGSSALADGGTWGSSTSLATTTTTTTTAKATELSAEEQQQQSDPELDDVGLVFDASYDESQKSTEDDNEEVAAEEKDKADRASPELEDSSMNDVWVEFLLKTGSIIELNAFMDETLGIGKD